MLAHCALLCFTLVTPLASAAPPLDWDYNGRAVPGVVRVMPVLTLEPVHVNGDDTWVGAGLPDSRQRARDHRHQALGAIPNAIAEALPGAINSIVGPSWGGHFTVGRFGVSGRRRASAAVSGPVAMDTLEDIASKGAQAGTLFVWVTRVDAVALSSETFDGDIVNTQTGPVVVDHRVEPYRVTATVGTALVASDGQLVVRYLDHFEAPLTERGADDTGRRIARAMAEQLALIWPSDPRLRDELAAR